MKLYTKTGDRGETSLIGGKRVSKSHPRIEAYGTIDELIAFIGLLRDHDMDEKYRSFLLWIQDRLMTSASLLACDQENCDMAIPRIKTEDVNTVEKEIDVLDETLPQLTSFIIPGGHKVVSFCHIARNVCRRAERLVNVVEGNQKYDLLILQFLNRLSDYLFVLSRRLSEDYGINEVRWQPKL